MMQQHLDNTDTKTRLLDAGAREFAEHGFRDASIRQICARATANPAAVNYHFGNKERFYAEVLVTCHQRAVAKRRMPRLADDPEHPERALNAWLRWFLELLLVESRSSPLGKLMAGEMFQPTAAFDELIRRSLLPMHSGLCEIVGALIAGPDGDPPDMRELLLYANSVLGQCLLYKHAEAALDRLRALAASGEVEHPVDDLAGDLDDLARHIANFSLAGLRAYRSPADGDSR